MVNSTRLPVYVNNEQGVRTFWGLVTPASFFSGNVPLPNPYDPYVLLNNGQGVFAQANLLPVGSGHSSAE